jgi:hypothetical protein
MSDLFEDKSAMPGNANIQMASDRVLGGPPSDAPVRVIQTMQERRSDRADAAMSVRNLFRPRRGHAY